MPPSRSRQNGRAKPARSDELDHGNLSINTSQLLGRKNNRLNDLLKRTNSSSSDRSQKEDVIIAKKKPVVRTNKRKSAFEIDDDDGFRFKRSDNVKKTKTKPNAAQIKEEDEQELKDYKLKNLEPVTAPAKRSRTTKSNGKTKSKKSKSTITKQEEEDPFIFQSNHKRNRDASPPSPPITSSPTFVEQHSSHQISLAVSDTPIIRRNQQLRNGGKRRSSLNNRGKRVSSIGNGFVATPHEDVSPKEYYKLIDPSLPEPHKMKQLLIWCFKKILDRDNEQLNIEKKSGKVLSNDETTVINIAKVIKDEIIHDLMNGKLNTSWYNKSDDEEEQPVSIKIFPNKLNTTNEENIKLFEKRLKDLKQEAENWRKSYDGSLKEATTMKFEDTLTVVPKEINENFTQVVDESLIRKIESSTQLIIKDLGDEIEDSVDNLYDLNHKLTSTSKVIEKFTDTTFRKLDGLMKDYMKRDTMASENKIVVVDMAQSEEARKKHVGVRDLLKGISRLDRG